ncbi:MAG: hydrogenase nickel incorporation protein HypB [Dongiaceae bacterium]
MTKLADGTDGAGHDHHHHHHHHDHGGDHDHHHHDHGDDHHHHDHHHDADHHHHHHGNEPSAATVRLEAEILAKNREIAERNRSWLAGREVLALNLVSSPGSGKTTLLERTIRDLGGSRAIAVIEGDQATPNDGQRIRAAGAAAVQINTGTGCHLEADMVARAIGMLRPAFRSLLFIENVGNLVCPALFDLGERAKVAILSVTEGEDKPMKYPHLFQAARLVLLNKIDLLPHLDFDLDRCLACARDVNPECPVLPVSARTGEGLDRWYDWLRSEAEAGVAASA